MLMLFVQKYYVVGILNNFLFSCQLFINSSDPLPTVDSEDETETTI